MAVSREGLDQIYRTYNSRRWVHPDPLEFLYGYRDPLDREIVGIIASSLAYGRVLQILKSVGFVLERMGPSPRDFLVSQEEEGDLVSIFRGFKHRFHDSRRGRGTSSGDRACGQAVRFVSKRAFVADTRTDMIRCCLPFPISPANCPTCGREVATPSCPGRARGSACKTAPPLPEVDDPQRPGGPGRMGVHPDPKAHRAA